MSVIELSKYIVVGNVDSGKSSFIGVMEKNVLDDGRGYARSLVTKLKHEKETGKTSSHSYHYIVNNNEVTTLIDLCGHEKYLKTTVFGIMGMFCDYGIVIIGANMGITDITKEHISLLISTRIPFIILINKIDLCPPDILVLLKKKLDNIFRKSKKTIYYFESEDSENFVKCKEIVNEFPDGNTSKIPAILTSNKTGYNISFIKQLLTSIKPRSQFENLHNSSVMYIDSIFTVHGIGIVLSGTCKYGDLHVGQKVYLGPINDNYISVTIKSIHNCIKQSISILKKNESGCIAIRLDDKNSFNKNLFRKGQIIVSDLEFAQKNTCREFNCDIAIFNNPTTIKKGYCAFINCITIRQTGRFLIDDNTILRSNSRENLNIQFTQRSEFILPESLFVFRDGRTKGVGLIKKTYTLSKYR
jgi:elongation factor 1-alpha